MHIPLNITCSTHAKKIPPGRLAPGGSKPSWTASAKGRNADSVARPLSGLLTGYCLLIHRIQKGKKRKLTCGSSNQSLRQIHGRAAMAIGNLAEINKRRPSGFRHFFCLVTPTFLNKNFRIHGITIAFCYSQRNSILHVAAKRNLLSN